MSELSATDVGPFIDMAFEQMLEKAAALGDAVNERPDTDGANSVFVLVVHCIGVADWWLDHAILGNPTARDRPSEFTSSGSVAELQRRVDDFRARLPALLAAVEQTSVPALPKRPDHDEAWAWTTSSIVLHVIEELFQHAGHVDITADLLA